MAQHSWVNKITIAALDDVREQIASAIASDGRTITKLADVSGVARKTIIALKPNKTPENFPKLDTLVMVLDALGFDEITIKWR